MYINRFAVVVKAKQPFVDWINSTAKAYGDKSGPLSLGEVNDDCLVLLIPEFDSDEEARGQVSSIKKDIFEESLGAWYTDKEHWPKDRTEKLFDEWFDLEIHSDVVDTVDEPIEKEDLDI